MAVFESWHVRSRGRECSVTHRSFDKGEKIITALFPDPETSGYLRKDYCAGGWELREGPELSPFSFWKNVFETPVAVENSGSSLKMGAEAMLSKLIFEDENDTENTRYILAIMLERRKLLRETDSQRTPSGILRIYEHRKSGEIFIVKDPDIPLDRVESVQNEVFSMLENYGRSRDDRETTDALAGVQISAPSNETSAPGNISSDA